MTNPIFTIEDGDPLITFEYGDEGVDTDICGACGWHEENDERVWDWCLEHKELVALEEEKGTTFPIVYAQLGS